MTGMHKAFFSFQCSYISLMTTNMNFQGTKFLVSDNITRFNSDAAVLEDVN